MDREKAEYFNKLCSQSSQKSIIISQQFTTLKQQELANFIDNVSSTLLNHNNRMKTQKQGQDKKGKRVNTSTSQKVENQTQKPSTLKQLIEDDQKLLKKYENQLVDLRISKKLYETSNQNTSTLQKLKTQKDIAMCIRKERELIKMIEEVHKSKAQKIEKYEKQRAEIKQKKELILERLKKKEEDKNKRQEIFSAKSLPALPRYKLMEKKFIIQEIKRQIDNNLQSKRLKEQKNRNYLGLGSIEESRINRINSELTNMKKHLKTEDSMKNFTKKELQQRRSHFLGQLDQKRKHKVIQVDKAKELEIAILKDKKKNPLKYNFLKLKNLTQQQIFRDFKDYELNFDSKQIGNEYLQESKLNAKPRKAKIDEEGSQSGNQYLEKGLLSSKSQLPTIEQKTSRERRINSWNIHDNRHIGDKNLLDYKQKIYKMLRNSQSKSKVIQLLAQESNKKQKNLVHLQEQLQRSSQYEECMKIQKHIDSDYLQLLKAKIVALKIQQ